MSNERQRKQLVLLRSLPQRVSARSINRSFPAPDGHSGGGIAASFPRREGREGMSAFIGKRISHWSES